ncbi:Lipase (class 3) [Rosistilla oblonga]|uniref:Lipase (Class 3) n=2 Tax=Rosistilla oblonga TaxID=2527990 RepID=A0A518IT50_9BACT|nr:Lipase (class 3) [Rosistilla oblonga]
MLFGGIGGFLAVLLVIIVGLFASPSNDSVDIEDRTDWEPPTEEELTPKELLALGWSSHDPIAHWPVASLMLELSDIAYLPPATAREKIRELGWESESINAGSMQGYVIDAGDDSIVTFRGTEGHEYDIVQDLRFIGVNTEQGAMHGGFAKGYDSMHDQVVELLERYQTKRVWLTGHSLGGGLAVVCAYRLLEGTTYPIAGMMTFGQPKVVRSQLVEYLGPKLIGKYVFFVNDMDPVTRVISPYEHFGHMVRWNDNDIERSQMLLMSAGADSPAAGQEAGYIEGMTQADFQELLRSVEESNTPKFDENGNQLVQGFVPNVFDHYLDAYREMLEQLRTHSNR